MTLRKYLRSVTRREHRTWLAWLDEQWNRPDRTDHYLMQISADVRRPNTKHPERCTLESARLKFTKPEPPRELTPEEKERAAAMAKLAWLGRVGMLPEES